MKDNLKKEFYLNPDVCDAAKKLLGKFLCVRSDNHLKTGMITETEAYEGVTDRASHAFNNRRTKRTQTIYMDGGVAYVYLCYGIHYLFNVVTNVKDVPHAVLIRSVVPVNSLEAQALHPIDFSVNGPGKVTKYLGIQKKHNGISLTGNSVFIYDNGIIVSDEHIITSPRIGVDYAGEDALLPYRFFLKKEFVTHLFIENEICTGRFKKG
jgi:DNA-3-methyladenine glycosylase